MDPTAPMEETCTRPHREARLPPRLMDYEVGFPGPGSSPPITSTRSSGRPRSTFEESPQRSSSSSGKHTAYSASLYPQDGLFPIQAAILEENAKQLKVINFQRQIEESAESECELQRIQAQAKAAQQAQEEAILAREAIGKRLDQRRRLQQLQADLQLAKLVTSILSTNIITSSTCHPPPEATGSPAPENSALHQHSSSPATVEPQQPSNPVQAVTAAQVLPAVPITSQRSINAAPRRAKLLPASCITSPFHKHRHSSHHCQ